MRLLGSLVVPQRYSGTDCCAQVGALDRRAALSIMPGVAFSRVAVGFRCDARLPNRTVHRRCTKTLHGFGPKWQNGAIRRVNCAAEAADAVPAEKASSSADVSASAVARQYYEYYNAKQFDKLQELFAEECVYEDLVYQDAFRGRAAVVEYLQKVEKMVPADIMFVVEDITEGGLKAGVRWHVELEGNEFPFSRGVSFYEINSQGRIVFARDIVEPTIKPGGAALQGIKLVAPLVRKLGPKANPAYLKDLPIAAASMWSLYAVYFGYVMFSTTAPGMPVWKTDIEMLRPVIHESFNFFYVNIGLAQLGINPAPNVAEHPVDEALFNFMNAWSLMFLPLIVADPRSERVQNKYVYWTGTMFLTNVFLMTYMAARLANPSDQSVTNQQPTSSTKLLRLPAYSGIVGIVGGGIGAFSLMWAISARPEFGGLIDRWQFFQTMFGSNRVFWAFCVDAGLYSIWQATLMRACGAPLQYALVPFAGLAAWLTNRQTAKP